MGLFKPASYFRSFKKTKSLACIYMNALTPLPSFLPYARQSITDAECLAATEALRGEWITRGPQVAQFEEAIATYCGSRFAVAFSSGTAALAAAYFAGHLHKKIAFITTPNSFVASLASPYQMGIQPYFVDIDCRNGGMDVACLSKILPQIDPMQPICLTPVHFAGIAVDMAFLKDCVKDRPTLIIEDAAHAIGSFYPTGEKVGSCPFSDMTIFSFHPAKTITTGDGGMVTTNDQALYKRLKLFRDNGIERTPPLGPDSSELHPQHTAMSRYPGYYEVQAVTGNFHMTSFQAAIGLQQLLRIDEMIAKRRRLIQLYRSLLQNRSDIQLFSQEYDEKSAFHLFVVQIDFTKKTISKKNFMEELKTLNIGSQVHYIPLYRHPIFAHSSVEIASQCPKMEAYYSQALSLPLYFDLQEGDVVRIALLLQQMLDQYTCTHRSPSS